MKSCVSKFHNNPPLEIIPAKDDELRISSLSSLESAEPWGVSRQTRLFKIANRWARAIGSVEKGIKRPKCVAQKPLKKVNRTRGVKRSQPMRFGLWRELVPLLSLFFFISLSLCIIVFSTMIYDRNDHCICVSF